MKILNKHFSNSSLKITKSESLAELISLALLYYMILAIFAICLSMAVCTLLQVTSDAKASVISNFFVWSATLYAPVLVILLINSWKVQKDFELRKELALNTLNDLRPIFVELIELRTILYNISNTSNQLVLYKKYLDREYLNLSTKIFECYSNIEVLNTLYKSKGFNELYTSLEKHCIDLNINFTYLTKTLYKNYYENAVFLIFESAKKEINVTSNYGGDQKIWCKISATKIKEYIYSNKDIKLKEKQGKNWEIFEEYEDLELLLEGTIKYYQLLKQQLISLVDLDSQ